MADRDWRSIVSPCEGPVVDPSRVERGVASEPKVGQVWERDGRQREVMGFSRIDSLSVFDRPVPMGNFVVWRKPPSGALRRCWCATWAEWVSKARLVRDSAERGAGR